MSSLYAANIPPTGDSDDSPGGPAAGGAGESADSTGRLRWKGPQEASADPPAPASPPAPGGDGPGGTRPVKRASILKSPGAEKSNKHASIDPRQNMQRIPMVSSSSISAASAASSRKKRQPQKRSSSDISRAAAKQTPNNEKRKRKTTDLSIFGRKSKSELVEDDSAQEREGRSISHGLGVFRSRSSQANSEANWSRSESEAESAPNKPPPGSHQHRRNHSNVSAVSMSGASTGGASRMTAASTATTAAARARPKTLASWCCSRCKTCICPQLPKSVTDWITQHLIDARAWQAFTIVFTIVLLFGTQIQDLWCPKSSDVAFDVLFTCAFVFLIADVLLRSVVDPTYFIFNLCGKDLRSPTGEHTSNRVDALCGLRSFFQIGSFMFWCDLLSTLSLLWDISYIGSWRASMLEITIRINDLGVPVEGIATLNEQTPVQVMDVLVIEVMIAILRTLRVSRFIKTSAVVNISSKVNWYWLPERIDPKFWFRKCYGKGNIEKGGGGGILSEMSDSAPLDLGESLIRSSANAVRRSSFTSTGSGVHEEGRGAGIAVNYFLLKFGVQNRRIKEFERQIAATKIQRAWRQYCESTGKNAKRRNIGGATVSRKASTLEAAKNMIMRKRSSTVSTAPVDAEAKKESQVGSAMRELTGQRVVIGIIIALVMTVLFTFSEINSTAHSTMIVLHEQTQDASFSTMSLDAARNSTIPQLFAYKDASGNVTNFTLPDGTDGYSLRRREIMNITIKDPENATTAGLFDIRQVKHDSALVELIDTIFILLIWFFGVTAFAGPVMVLVVTPIERMIRLLSMLMKDPLGFQGTSRYKKFVAEEDKYTKNTRWTKDVLKGMETSFLMTTILRIGSLMKVGFGAAGVEIIRNNLEKGESKDGLVLNTQGTTVQCIFLFCDIRQFTDATESLQEEVFVFTNKIASVVHSMCNSYGGSANKNVGDAFLMSWLLSDEKTDAGGGVRRRGSSAGSIRGPNRLTRTQIKADSALLAVVKICIALYYDKFFLEDMTDAKRGRLMKKIAKRMGPVVQMGFGLHCGKAVQGAIGTQRKLDATYVSDAVEFAEFLESSTKQFGVKMLMSDAFQDLLSPQAKRRCRKVDQILIVDDDMDPDDPDLVEIAEKVELYTFDIDIDELWKDRARTRANANTLRFGPLDSTTSHSANAAGNTTLGGARARPSLSARPKSRRDILGKLGAPSGMNLVNARNNEAPTPQQQRGMVRRRTSLLRPRQGMANLTGSFMLGDGSVLANEVDYGLNERGVPINMPELILPSGKTRYSLSSWNTEEMRTIRKKFSDGLFFQQFNNALQAYYSGDWKSAGETFTVILERFEDGPSRYYMGQIEAHNGMPPRKFLGYNVV